MPRAGGAKGINDDTTWHPHSAHLIDNTKQGSSNVPEVHNAEHKGKAGGSCGRNQLPGRPQERTPITDLIGHKSKKLKYPAATARPLNCH